MDITTAEGLTRYLRSQDVPFDNIIGTLNELMDSNSNLLPNLNIFTVELIVDRLNDFKNAKFKKVKLDYKIWDLLIKLWDRFNEAEMKLKNNHLRRLKFSEIVVNVLTNTRDFQAIGAMLRALGLIIGSNILDLSIDDSTHIVRSYLDLILLLETNPETRSRWTKTILNMYDTSARNNPKLMSKKYLSEFSSSTLISLLKACTSELIDAEVKNILCSFIIRVLLTSEVRPLLVSNVETLIKGISEEEAILLDFMFGMIVTKVDDVSMLQEIFILMNGKSPELELSMLEQLSKHRKSLTTNFLNSLVEDALASTNSNRYPIIYHILELDIGVGFRFGEKIFANCLPSKPSNHDMDVKIASKLIHSFIVAREFELFYDHWITMIDASNSFFKSEDFETLVTNSLTYLSSFQLDRILKQKIIPHISQSPLSDSAEKYLVTLIPFVQFAISCNDETKKRALELNLIKLLTLKVGSKQLSFETNQIIWKTRYFLLCLFEKKWNEIDELYTEASKIIIEAASGQLNTKNIYIFYTLFKLREIKNFNLSEIVTSSFVEALSKGDNELFEFCFMRWIVIFNLYFKEADIASLVKVLLKYKESKQSIWDRIFENCYIFEQSNLMLAIISQLRDSVIIEKTRGFYLSLISKIPVQCYSKMEKVKMMDFLTDIAIESSETDISFTALSTILKLEEFPTLKSKVETDWKVILKLLEIENSSGCNIPSQIFRSIWKNHQNHAQEDVHKTWLDGVLKKLNKFYNKKSVKRLSGEHFASAVILSIGGEDLEELSTKFQESLLSLLGSLSKNMVENITSVTWILSKFYSLDVQLSLTSDLSLTLRNIGTSSQQCHLYIFNILCKIYSTEFEDVAYMMALYVLLRPENPEINATIKSYLNRLNIEELLKGFDYLLQGFSDVGPEEWHYVSLIGVFIESFNDLRKKNHNDHDEKLQFYVTFALSTIMASNVKSGEGINCVLNILKLLLTDMGWVLTQYSFELMMSVMIKAIVFTRNQFSEASVRNYILSTQVLSNVLLHHRHRLSNRHHLVMNNLCELMECLFSKKNQRSAIAESVECGKSFERLLGNLCEPANIPQSSSANQLNSASSSLKKILRRYVPIVLINYIYLQIRYKMQNKIRDEIVDGIYVVINTLTQDELVVVNSSLDGVGKSYFKLLYNDYKKFGKWQDDV